MCSSITGSVRGDRGHIIPNSRNWGRAAVIEELKEGHSLVFVYASDEGTTDNANRIVRAAGAYKISHRGRWVTTHLL